MVVKHRNVYVIVMAMSTSVGFGFENIHHIHQSTSRAWYNTLAINFVDTPQDGADPNSLIQYFSLCLRRAVASFGLLVLLYFMLVLLAWWCLTPRSTIFQLYWSSHFFLAEETGGPGENYRLVASRWQTFSHNVLHLPLIEIRTHSISCNCHWLHR